MDLDGYSRHAEAFTCAVAHEHYRHFAGLQAESRTAGVYERHAGLFDVAAIDGLRADPRRHRLLRFAVEGHLALATRALDAELARRESLAFVEVAGPRGGVTRLGYREAALAQAAEPDAGRRARLDAGRGAVAREQLAPLVAEALELRAALARELGWPSYRALYEETTGVDVATLALQAGELLRRSEGAYRAALARLARRARVAGNGELRRADLGWLLRSDEDDARFPAGRLLPALHSTLGELGIDLDAQRGRLVLDVQARTGKSPRAFCAAVRVPHEVYLVVAPGGGRAGCLALMHEGGHAQHFAGTDAALPFELRCLGDAAVGEAFGFLLEGLVGEPAWLGRHLGLSDPDGELAGRAAARRLMLVRRYAAKLGHELELHGGAGPEGGALADGYAGRLEAALGVKWPSDTWLTDVDPGLYVVSYLRGWALEAGLRRALRDELGDDWFAQERAGALLAGLWRQGQSLSAEEILERVAPRTRLDVAALGDAT